MRRHTYIPQSLSRCVHVLSNESVFKGKMYHHYQEGARWLSGKDSDSRARGVGFDTYLRRVVPLSKDTFTPRKVLVIPRKQWLHPDMTEKLLTGTLSINTNKTIIKMGVGSILWVDLVQILFTRFL